ncbi:MAG: hypothetical protein IPO81_19045 [Kouleothrix sp.]|nr:hypothetical protein [Kouleothrix sp.]MBK9713378.1 hypothetical protein [Kouleothrix sp.]
MIIIYPASSSDDLKICSQVQAMSFSVAKALRVLSFIVRSRIIVWSSTASASSMVMPPE